MRPKNAGMVVVFKDSNYVDTVLGRTVEDALRATVAKYALNGADYEGISSMSKKFAAELLIEKGYGLTSCLSPVYGTYTVTGGEVT